jgi:hypothetical protein
MTDGPEPFGKETAKAAQEIAKTADNAIDAARDLACFFNRVLGNPIVDVVGISISDPLRFVRTLSLDWYSRRVEEILAKRNAKHLKGAPPRIAFDILEAAQDETRDELRELWVQLLANAMDETTQRKVRIEFVAILKQLNPLDALVLQRLSTIADSIHPRRFAQAQHLDANDVATSFMYLVDLKCVDLVPHGNYDFKISPRGIALLKAFDDK